ncbi:MAG: glycoside hydrolase family 3 N-terminal domain-containing protein [Clostridia bacterium]|nr:glycoside hydrolase family 3 N-terminal domain-containing protein [Clostridia bacterium]
MGKEKREKKTRERKFLNTKGKRVWMGVSVPVMAVLLVATIVATQYLSGLMDMLFGGERTEVSGSASGSYALADGVTDKASALQAANDLNLEINEEGIILLKNENCLPLTSGAKVSVFGKNSVNLAYGSSGSVGSSSDNAPTIYDSLQQAGFVTNPTLEAFYNDSSKSGSGRASSPSMLSGSIVTGFATGETAASAYDDSVKASFAEYSDAALVVITRVSGENYDLPTTMWESDGTTPVTGAASGEDHYLELDQNEQDMLKMACENFDHVILVINSSTPLELGFLDGNNGGDATMVDYDFASHVDGALWIGMPGESDIIALGEVLNGTVNPSGHTVDTFARDFMAIPAVQNYSCNGELNSDAYTLNGSAQNAWYIDYEEGIYVGYRYFETRGAGDEDWYQENVVYPFGYGLSYTTFTQTIKETGIQSASDWTKADEAMTITVTVTNTGSVAGKDVVQVYAHAPYIAGGIEKAEVVLVAYVKTDLLQPGESGDYTVSFTPYDFASYDADDKNGNGHSGYELDEGEYIFSVRSDAHTVLDSVTTTLVSTVCYDTDTTTGYTVENRFDDVDDQLDTILSRSNWEGTWPKNRTADEKKMENYEGFQAALKSTDSGNPLTAADEAVTAANAARTPAKKKSADGLQLYEMIGKDYDDEQWNAMLSRITLNTIWDTLSDAAFKTIAIDYIGMPATIATDGPSGFTKFMGSTSTIYDTCFYASECVLAATWNQDLAERMGEAIGDEALIGDANNNTPYTGWYAPAVNIHRTPFGGRNPEYYSEDCTLSGTMAAKVVAGAAKKGLKTYVKHFVANEQETHRGGVCTWLTEQSLRELYLKPFEHAVKEGGTLAIMSSFNRIGSRWAGGSYALLTEVLRNEWGFKGTVISDFASGQSHMNLEQQLYAGGDLWLDTIAPTKFFESSDPLDVYVLQEAMKHVLYTVTNSNALNGIGSDTVVETSTAYWRIALTAADIAVPAVLLLWGVLVLVKAAKKKKPEQAA